MFIINPFVFGGNGGGDGGGDTDLDFADVVLLFDYSDRGEGTDSDFADVVLLVDNSIGE